LLSIIVPTYNERGNIQPLYQAICQALQDFELIFVDDSSPDGTAQIIRELQVKDRRVKLRERGGKLGLGSAILYGLEIATGEYIAMMDADLSHPPRELPKMMQALSEADMVIGSRYIAGGRVEGWPIWRRIMSRMATISARLFLNIGATDPLSGFAMFRRDILEGVRNSLSPQGFKLLLEILVKAGEVRVKEVPIVFTNRTYGTSKLGLREIEDFVRLCFRMKQHQC
jgi:dolichol-phosphate mannosyltransferase